MDWNACIICEQSSGDLRCPVDSFQSNGIQVYNKFIEAVGEFQKLDAMPISVKFDHEAENLAELFYQNKAKWHKSCHLKFATSKLMKIQERRGKKREHASISDPRRSKRQSNNFLDEGYCIFCSQASGKLHQCATMELDYDLRKMAKDLQDSTLIAKLSGGDLIAIEAKYHFNCLSDYKNRHRSFIRLQKSCSNEKTDEKPQLARAFAELMSHIESSVENGSYMFKLTELHSLFEDRLHTLGVEKSINKSRLKKQVLDHFSGECQEQSDGKNTLLVFNEGMKKLLKESMTYRDYESEAILMVKLVKVIRQEIFDWEPFQFSGNFPPKCQENSVPPTLQAFMSMLLNGPNVQQQDSSESQACLTLSQLVCFNVKSGRHSAENSRHCRDRETPLPLYVGLNIHTQTRSKKILSCLHRLGISISYNRVIELENCLANAICTRFEDEGVVCPSHLRKNLITIGALDNIDHNLSSTTAQGSFHGTGISVFQFPTASNSGICRDPITFLSDNNSSDFSLPESYINMSAVTTKISDLALPQAKQAEIQGHLDRAKTEEVQWTKHAMQLLIKDKLEHHDYLSWAAFHASTQPDSVDPIALIALLPLFSEKAATITMIKHGMDVLRKITNYLNPGQVPVMAFDQPLFALAKYVQWSWPESLGEHCFVVMFGGLHIEMAVWDTIGGFLDCSGWTTALCEAGIATSGVADSFLRVSHLTRTRRSHQITALVLTKLQEDAWKCANKNVTFLEWKQDMMSQSPTFRYWNLVLEFEILAMIFIRAHRINDFKLYIESLEALAPWFFALDHTNYARWIPIHIRDMKSLSDDIKRDLELCWVLKKTQNKFSCIPIDQAHEQNNELVKGCGGAVGLTENPTAFRRWMVAGPEQARLLTEFESQFMEDGDTNLCKQHEQGLSFQELFKKHVNSLHETMTNMGNPFKDIYPELLTLDSRVCATEGVIATVQTIESVGTMQYQKYVTDVIVNKTVSIHQPIKKNSLPLFKRQSQKVTNKSKQKVASLKSDCNLFSHLYIASKFRDGDLDDFFSHENHPWPPSISEHGKLRLPTKKSDLLSYIDAESIAEPPPTFHAKIFDGPVIVHTLPNKQVSTFDEYAQKVFVPWTNQQLNDCDRIDIVWDRYEANSLKEATREKRGKGIRRKVQAQTKLPTNFADFLRDPVNKTELFELLTEKVATYNYPNEKQVYITSGKSVVCKGHEQSMLPCNLEEADSRICVHVQDALQKGAHDILVSTVDTDVIVILVGAYFAYYNKFPDVNVYVGFGTGKYFKYYHINSICQNLGNATSRALPFFHAFTGCDTTSQFLGKGKKSAWECWISYPEVTKAFLFAAEHPFELLDLHSPEIRLLERYVCVLYDRTTSLCSVNEVRKELFCKRAKTMEGIPPTQCALLQHSNRALYQASIWTTCLQEGIDVPLPEGFGWKRTEDSHWMPIWTLLPEIVKASRDLIKCSCKAEPLCSRKCKCQGAGLPCTALCQCGGMCA